MNDFEMIECDAYQSSGELHDISASLDIYASLSAVTKSNQQQPTSHDILKRDDHHLYEHIK